MFDHVWIVQSNELSYNLPETMIFIVEDRYSVDSSNQRNAYISIPLNSAYHLLYTVCLHLAKVIFRPESSSKFMRTLVLRNPFVYANFLYF